MAIKTITPRLPRVGTIRLGTKKTSARGFEYPVNSEHFIFPQEGEPGNELLAGRFDEATSVLRIQFPVNDLDVVLSDFYRRHTASGLQCRGDGEIGLELQWEERVDAKGKKYNHRELVEVPCASRGCPYPLNKECGPSGILAFLIEGVPTLGVWHLTTHSINAIQEFKAVLQLALLNFGRITNLPFELYRKPIEVNPDGRKKTVWTVGLRLSASVSQNLLQAGPVVPTLDEPFVDSASEAMAAFGGQDNQSPTAAANDDRHQIPPKRAETARASTAGEPPSEDPPPPPDAWNDANALLRAVAGEHGKGFGFKGQQIADAIKRLLGGKSSKDCTPDDLRDLAGRIKANPKLMIEGHHQDVGEQVIETTATAVGDDDDIPAFDDPITPAGDQVDTTTGEVKPPIDDVDLWLAICDAMPDAGDQARVATLDALAKARLKAANGLAGASEHGRGILAKALRETPGEMMALAAAVAGKAGAA